MTKTQSHSRHHILLQKIIEMGNALGLKCIAEGVENQTLLSVLSSLHCDYVQGFLFHRPMPKEEFENLCL